MNGRGDKQVMNRIEEKMRVLVQHPDIKGLLKSDVQVVYFHHHLAKIYFIP